MFERFTAQRYRLDTRSDTPMRLLRPNRFLLAALLALIAWPALGFQSDGTTVGDRAATLRGLVGAELAHWYPASIDAQRGGFHQNFARDWTVRPDENTFQVYQARMTWTAAAFAEFEPMRRDEFLDYARHGIAFLDEVMRDKEHGGFHWILDRDGKLDPSPRRREARLRHRVRHLRGEQGPRRRRRRPGAQGRARRLRLARRSRPRRRARRLLRGDPPRRDRDHSLRSRLRRSTIGPIAWAFITASRR